METRLQYSRESRTEMAKVVRSLADDLKPLVAEALPVILKREDFKRAYDAYLRIESATRIGRDSSIDVTEVRRDFGVLVKGHILRASGCSYERIGGQLGDDRVGAWLMREQIPFSMYRDDPIRNAHFIKRMEIPQGMSTDFAYVLGAYAGTRRPSSESIQVGFQSASPALIEQLCMRVSASCGIDLNVRSMQLGAQLYLAATSRAHEFAEYLAGVSQGNTTVPWIHIQTAAERRDFLRGFFDFGGGTVDLEKGRFAVTRNENSRLLEEVAILLKRENVHARLRTSSATTLFVDATVELIALAALDVVQRPDLAGRLKSASAIPSARQLVSATDYDAVMEVAQRLRALGGATAARVSAALKDADHPGKDIPRSTIRHWLSGGFEPPSSKRRGEIEDLERKNFTAERVAEIGRAILGRLPALPHPYVVVGATAEFVGGARALASAANVELELVQRVLDRAQIPSESTYRAIRAVIGIDSNTRIEAGARCPDVDSVRALFSKPEEQGLFSVYRASVMLRVREAFERGEDIEHAAREAVRRASERTHRVNGDG